jgi:hypothetical protein
MFITVRSNLMDKLNKLIQIIRILKEDGPIGGAPTNSVGDGGLTSSGNKLAGYDKVMNKIMRRRGPIIGLGKNSRKRWMR